MSRGAPFIKTDPVPSPRLVIRKHQYFTNKIYAFKTRATSNKHPNISNA